MPNPTQSILKIIQDFFWILVGPQPLGERTLSTFLFPTLGTEFIPTKQQVEQPAQVDS